MKSRGGVWNSAGNSKARGRGGTKRGCGRNTSMEAHSYRALAFQRRVSSGRRGPLMARGDKRRHWRTASGNRTWTIAPSVAFACFIPSASPLAAVPLGEIIFSSGNTDSGNVVVESPNSRHVDDEGGRRPTTIHLPPGLDYVPRVPIVESFHVLWNARYASFFARIRGGNFDICKWDESRIVWSLFDIHGFRVCHFLKSGEILEEATSICKWDESGMTVWSLFDIHGFCFCFGDVEYNAAKIKFWPFGFCILLIAKVQLFQRTIDRNLIVLLQNGKKFLKRLTLWTGANSDFTVLDACLY